MAKGSSKGSGRPIPKVVVDLDVSRDGAVDLLNALKARFEHNTRRHEGLEWAEIQARIEAQPGALATLHAMERTGGEPDVVGYDEATDEYIVYDCSAQSPVGRRSVCYDGAAQAEREKKGVVPGGNAVDIAAAMGVELLDEDQYHRLQRLGEFDTTTESWIETPTDIRERGGAIFAARRYGRVFVFHNSAPSFYASRGFRGSLRLGRPVHIH
jgi:hypothetical protein